MTQPLSSKTYIGTFTRVWVPLINRDPRNHELMHFCLGFVEQACRASGFGRCLRLVDGMCADFVGLTEETVRIQIDAMAASAVRRLKSCRVIFSKVEGELQCNSAAVLRGEFTRTKLTRKLFFSLPIGAYVVSNCFETRYQSIYIVHLDDRTDRKKLWALAVKRGADQRCCEVHWHKGDFETWAGSTMTVPDANV